MSKKNKDFEKEEKDGAGRKKAKLDWEEIGKSLMTGSSGAAIARKLLLHPTTLWRRCEEDLGMMFSEFKNECVEVGNDLLRNKQFDLAMKGDRSMLIWLGKNRLGQSDKKEVKSEVNSVNVNKLDISKLSDEQLRAFEQIYTELTELKGDSGGEGEA